jgi:Terminase large subunit, T4likevirus-type, N-terminal
VIVSDLRAGLSPVVFAQEVLDFTPDPWQENVLETDAKRLALCCSRQAGKSTVSSILALHTALYRPGSLVVMVSPSQRQSGELFKKTLGYLETLAVKPRVLEQNATSLVLENKSRIVSLPGSEATVRGYSAASLVIVDEAAFVEDGLFASVRPMLATSNGRLLLLSTPNGKRGEFWNAWNSSGIDWEKVSVPARECPRISSEFLEAERRTMTAYQFQQEYECAFVEGLNSIFDYNTVHGAFSSEFKPLDVAALLRGEKP